MKKALMIDLIQLRGTLLTLPLIVLGVAAFFGIMGGLGMLVVFLGTFLPVIVITRMLGRDESRGWGGFRATLPVTRKQIMGAHYVVVAGATIGTMALCVLVAIGFLFAMEVVDPYVNQGLGNALSAPGGMLEVQEIAQVLVGIAALFSAIVLVFFAVLMPLTAKLDYTRAFWIVFGLAAVLMFLYMFTSVGSGVDEVLSVFAPPPVAGNPDNTWSIVYIGPTALVASLLLNAISAPIAAKLYATRDL